MFETVLLLSQGFPALRHHDHPLVSYSNLMLALVTQVSLQSALEVS